MDQAGISRLYIDFFSKKGYANDSFTINNFLTRREMCFNGCCLYGGLALKLNSAGIREKTGSKPVLFGMPTQRNLS